MANRKLRRYSAEFKEQAVRLAEEIGRRQAGERLGIPAANINNWCLMKKKNMKLKGSKSDQVGPLPGEAPEEELKRLRRENEELKKVNYILKRAAAFFSQDHLK
jgi:transposase